MNICRLIGEFPHPADLDQSQNASLDYLLSGAYYMSKEQSALGDHVTVITGGGPKQESLGDLLVRRVGNPDNLWLGSELLRMKKLQELDLIHGHSTYGFLALSLLKRKLGVPLVRHVHATTLGLINSKYGRTYPPSGIRIQTAIMRERLAYSLADRLVAVSERGAQVLTRFYGFDRSKIVVVRNGVDTRLFHPMEKEAAKRSIGLECKRVVLFVGRMSRIKGIEYLLRAARRIIEKFDDVTFLFIGGVPNFMRGQAENPDDLLRHIGGGHSVADKIRFIGPVPNNLLPKYYSAAELVVLPSLYEAFPKVVVEAMACETPVIGSRVGGVPEVISDGTNGLLVPPADVEALFRAISLLLTDESLRQTLGVNAARTINSGYAWRDVAKELRRVYQGLGA